MSQECDGDVILALELVLNSAKFGQSRLQKWMFSRQSGCVRVARIGTREVTKIKLW